MRRVVIPGFALLIAAILASFGLVVVTAQVPAALVKYVEGALPLDPASPLWPAPVEVSLTSQTLVYPLSPTVETRSLSVSAVHNGTHVAIRLTWSDATQDVIKAGGLDVFPDAVAVQFPVSRAQLPYICMGTVDNPVNIIYWRAGAGVENLVAGAGYGLSPQQREALGLQATPTATLELLPPQAQVVTAYSKYEGGKWAVVIVRPLGSVHPLMSSLAGGFNAAFAVWDGSKGERGGLKATSGWVQFQLERPAAPTPTTVTVTTTVTTPVTVTTTEAVTTTRLVETTPTWAWVVIGVLIALIALLAGLTLRKK
ncbi:MAG: ethylbenzene dehydrogenase-related protein [Pyrobaculum sp.]